MLKTAILIVAVLAIGGCRLTGGRWVVEERCPGGVINTERRTVDTWVGGRVRNTVLRTDACIN